MRAVAAGLASSASLALGYGATACTEIREELSCLIYLMAVKYAVDRLDADIINKSLGIKHAGGALPHADVIRYPAKNGDDA